MTSKKVKDDGNELAASVVSTRPSSSEVIRDAKQWYAMKSIQTRRPITPRETVRVLYGSTPTRSSRPPSAYSIGPQSYDPFDDSSRPGSVTPVIKPRLTPLVHTPSIPADSELVILPVGKQKKSSPGNSASSADSTILTMQNSDSTRLKPTQDQHSGKEIMEETHDEALYWNTVVFPLLERLEGATCEKFTEATLSKVIYDCQSLFLALEKGSCFSQMSSRRKRSLLSTVYRLLNVKSQELHILCGKIIFEVRTQNKNLSSFCMLLFSICRDGQFDDLFIKHNLLKSMVTFLQSAIDIFKNYEKYKAFVYFTGSLKCLSDNEKITEQLHNLNCIKALTDFILSILKSLQEVHNEKRSWKYAGSLMVQVCSTYCNMLNSDCKLHQTLEYFPTLMQAFEMFLDDSEVVAVIARIFSKMTNFSISFSSFFEQKNWHVLFLLALLKHMKHPEICVHLTLVLGDLTSQKNKPRFDLYYIEQSSIGGCTCLDILMKLLENYTNVNSSLENSSSPNQVIDCLVKVVRVIAHLSICEVVGPEISSSETCINILILLLEKFDISLYEELIINVLATFNNLSYYCNTNSIVLQNRLRLAVSLSKLIVADKMNCVSEVIRVFGNLTKFKDVRNFLHKHKVSHMMVALLDSGERLIVYNACGVLVNMSADREKRVDIIDESSNTKLLELIRDFAPTEWRIGGIACQLLWNLSSDPMFVPHEDLIKLLEDFLSYKSVNKKMMSLSDDEESLNYLRLTWKEDFYEFAFPLLNKLKTGHFNLLPLDRPIESEPSSDER